jgi:DNA-binding response OmpR family regulator
LIVEDEPLVAQDIATILTSAGYVVAGMVETVPLAIGFARSGRCEAAVLDANLRGESAELVAEALQQAGTPFLVVSGYSRAHLKGALSNAPLLPKPFSRDALVCERSRL